MDETRLISWWQDKTLPLQIQVKQRHNPFLFAVKMQNYSHNKHAETIEYINKKNFEKCIKYKI
jgi:hypothetical protein